MSNSTVKIENGIATGRFYAVANRTNPDMTGLTDEQKLEAIAEKGSLVHRTKTRIPALLIQAEKVTKAKFAAIYSCTPQELENEEGQFYIRLYDEKSTQEISVDATGEKVITNVIGDTIAKALPIKGGHSVELSFTNARVRSYVITNQDSPFFGQTRYEVTGDLTSFLPATAKKFNIMDFPDNSFDLPKPQTNRRTVTAAAATQVSVAETQMVNSNI